MDLLSFLHLIFILNTNGVNPLHLIPIMQTNRHLVFFLFFIFISVVHWFSGWSRTRQSVVLQRSHGSRRTRGSLRHTIRWRGWSFQTPSSEWRFFILLCLGKFSNRSLASSGFQEKEHCNCLFKFSLLLGREEDEREGNEKKKEDKMSFFLNLEEKKEVYLKIFLFGFEL